jgi:hypothetical protein
MADLDFEKLLTRMTLAALCIAMAVALPRGVLAVPIFALVSFCWFLSVLGPVLDAAFKGREKRRSPVDD